MCNMAKAVLVMAMILSTQCFVGDIADSAKKIVDDAKNEITKTADQAVSTVQTATDKAI